MPGTHFQSYVAAKEGFKVGKKGDVAEVIDSEGNVVAQSITLEDGVLPLKELTEDPDTPSDGVVIWFDGTDIKAKNEDGEEATLNSDPF